MQPLFVHNIHSQYTDTLGVQNAILSFHFKACIEFYALIEQTAYNIPDYPHLNMTAYNRVYRIQDAFKIITLKFNSKIKCFYIKKLYKEHQTVINQTTSIFGITLCF